MEATVREYKINDKGACMAAFKSNVPAFFTEAEIADFENFLDRLPARQASDRTHYYVAIADDEVVGCGGFGDRDNNGTLTLAWGLVHRDFHKNGLGALLLKHRLECISKLYSQQPVFIDTTQHSYGFFERYGFKVTKVMEDFYAMGMHRYDMVYEKVS